MAKTGFNKAPVQPVLKRRQSFDFVEFGIWIIALSAISAFVTVETRLFIFDGLETESATLLRYIFLGIFIASIILAFFLDGGAKKRERESYEFKLKDYEMLRTKWLELASKELEQRSTMVIQQPMTVEPKQIIQQVSPLEQKSTHDLDE